MMVGISVVVPCYEEADNIEELVRRAFDGFRSANSNENGDHVMEMVLVDDFSGQETAESQKIVQKLKQEKGYDVDIVTRFGENGLSSAVVWGMRLAKYPVIVVMDADLQHPPEMIWDLVVPICHGEDVAIGSRFVDGATVENFALTRQILSKVGSQMARPILPGYVADPLSGFFALRKTTFLQSLRNGLNPIGFKVLLEILIRSGTKKVVEIPITFGERGHGVSKLSMKQNVQYLSQLNSLYQFKAVHYLTT